MMTWCSNVSGFVRSCRMWFEIAARLLRFDIADCHASDVELCQSYVDVY